MDGTLAITAITTFPALQDSISKIYSTIHNIYSHQYANIIEASLKELDVITSIQSIECFLKTLDEDTNDMVKLVVCRIHESINNIHTLLAKIEIKLNAYQRSKFMWLWGIDVYYELIDLKANKNILDKRIDTLTQILILNMCHKNNK